LTTERMWISYHDSVDEPLSLSGNTKGDS